MLVSPDYPQRLDLTIGQGSTFAPAALRWQDRPLVFKMITAITKAAPPVLTITGHGLPDGYPALVTSVQGMTQINARHTPPWDTDYVCPTVINANSVSLLVDASQYDTYTSGGVLAYLTPHSLSGYTARMQVRAQQDSSTVLLELTTENGRIALDDTAKTISLLVAATVTAALTFVRAVYDLELISGAGVVTRLYSGRVKLMREVTR